MRRRYGLLYLHQPDGPRPHADLLREAGYSDAEIEEMRAAGAAG